MDSALQYQIELNLAQANQKLDELLHSAEKSATGAGKSAGNGFGGAFLTVVEAYLAKLSFSALIGGIRSAVDANKELQKGMFGLTSTIEATNQAAGENNAKLKSGNLSLEEQASLLGINTDKLYKTESATKANSSATNAMEQAVRKTERAYNDANLALQTGINLKSKELKAFQEATQAKIRAVQGPGYDGLLNQRDTYELQLNALDTQRTQEQLAGQFTFQTDQQIAQLQLVKRLNDDKLKAIDIQTSAIVRQSKTQEQVLQDQISDLREQLNSPNNKLKIDFEEAKQKLSDFKASLTQGGAVKVLNQDLANQIKEAANKGIAQVDSGGMQEAMLKLYEKYGKIVSRGTLSSAFTNVIQAGITDTTQAAGLVDRYINAAAQGKSKDVSLDEAVIGSSQAFKTGQGNLNGTGISENASQIDAKGLNILNTERGTNVTNIKDLTEADQALARLKGTMELTKNRADGMTKALAYNADGTINYAESIKKGYLAQEIFDAQQRKLTQDIGKDLTPAYNELLAALIPLLTMFRDFVKDNPQIVVAFVAVATALSGILTFGLGVRAFFTVFGPLIGAILNPLIAWFLGITEATTILGGVLVVLLNPITWVVAAIALLTAGVIYLWNTNEGFRNGVMNAWQEAVKWVLWAKDHWLEALGEVVGFLISLPIKIPIWIGEAMLAMWDIISKYDWGGAWDGLVKGLMNAWESVKSFFGNINWGDLLKNVGNGFRDIFKGLFRGILTGIPGLNVDETLKNIGLYANGGYFTKPTLGIFGEAGDEAILNVNAIRMLGLTPSSVASLNSGSVSNSNSSSVSDSYNQSSNNYVNNFGSIFGASSQYA